MVAVHIYSSLAGEPQASSARDCPFCRQRHLSNIF